MNMDFEQYMNMDVTLKTWVMAAENSAKTSQE